MKRKTGIIPVIILMFLVTIGQVFFLNYIFFLWSVLIYLTGLFGSPSIEICSKIVLYALNIIPWINFVGFSRFICVYKKKSS